MCHGPTYQVPGWQEVVDKQQTLIENLEALVHQKQVQTRHIIANPKHTLHLTPYPLSDSQDPAQLSFLRTRICIHPDTNLGI